MSDHRATKEAFWAIVDFNWTPDEHDRLTRLWMAFRDANLSAW